MSKGMPLGQQITHLNELWKVEDTIRVKWSSKTQSDG